MLKFESKLSFKLLVLVLLVVSVMTGCVRHDPPTQVINNNSNLTVNTINASNIGQPNNFTGNITVNAGVGNTSVRFNANINYVRINLTGSNTFEVLIFDNVTLDNLTRAIAKLNDSGVATSRPFGTYYGYVNISIFNASTDGVYDYRITGDYYG